MVETSPPSESPEPAPSPPRPRTDLPPTEARLRRIEEWKEKEEARRIAEEKALVDALATDGKEEDDDDADDLDFGAL